ncbi:hypothetical protein BCR43DRAFT_499232 [Syncephalastrum racemosum]|uniref:Uncharacterized protein n=1 Tax=Syncephalastrum racemosum TaxID=13706 RepID=A0A1X2H005_SYNRA|nr:hypothetical protein BCR43DRAFT_499232 [Syncephalastrum racemosum]
MALQITNPDEYHEFISGSKFAVVIGYLPHEKPDLPYDRLNTLPLTKYAEVDCSQVNAICVLLRTTQKAVRVYYNNDVQQALY